MKSATTHTTHTADNTSAPGKLFLFGEYAVLCGGWTIVAAVNRRVTATRRTTATTYNHPHHALPLAVLETLGAPPDLTIHHLATDTTQFHHGPHKLGLGSSAASAVALTAALTPAATPDQIFHNAFQAHRLLQQGRGSGADVAASTYGGLLAYRLHHPTPPFPQLVDRPSLPNTRTIATADIAPLQFPGDLIIRAIWTGTPASSTRLIGQVEAALAANPATTTAALTAIATIAHTAATTTHTPDLITLFHEADAAMQQLADATHAPIITDRHRHLRQLAATIGAAAKPSGAGAGDFTLIAGPKHADWPHLRSNLPPGCQIIDLEFATPGVTTTAVVDPTAALPGGEAE